MTKHKTISIYVSWLNKRHWSDARRTVVNPKSLLSIWRVSELVSLAQFYLLYSNRQENTTEGSGWKYENFAHNYTGLNIVPSVQPPVPLLHGGVPAVAAPEGEEAAAPHSHAVVVPRPAQRPRSPPHLQQDDQSGEVRAACLAAELQQQRGAVVLVGGAVVATADEHGVPQPGAGGPLPLLWQVRPAAPARTLLPHLHPLPHLCQAALDNVHRYVVTTTIARKM